MESPICLNVLAFHAHCRLVLPLSLAPTGTTTPKQHSFLSPTLCLKLGLSFGRRAARTATATKRKAVLLCCVRGCARPGCGDGAGAFNEGRRFRPRVEIQMRWVRMREMMRRQRYKLKSQKGPGLWLTVSHQDKGLGSNQLKGDWERRAAIFNWTDDPAVDMITSKQHLFAKDCNPGSCNW